MPARRVLILGGTGDARSLAEALLARGHPVTTSLAGVTEAPILPPGDIHQGGFGGVAGLVAYVEKHAISVVADATHPFAARISANAAAACRSLSLPLFRLERPAWQSQPGDRWTHVATVSDAAEVLPSGARVLLTIGRKDVAPFFARPDISGIARMIENPQMTPPATWQVLRERPPFTLADEVALMRERSITHLVTKNAGGSATEAKLAAARQLGIPVVMVDRPAKPDVPCFGSIEALVQAIEGVLSP